MATAFAAVSVWPNHCFFRWRIHSLIHNRTPAMLFGLIDRVTSASSLKTGLDESVARSRSIADRVAKATLQNSDGFSLKANNGQNAVANANPINVEDEMVGLADEQMRFLATSRLLEKTYQNLRTAIKGTI